MAAMAEYGIPGEVLTDNGKQFTAGSACSARPGNIQLSRLPEPLVVTRRVSAGGAIMIGGQKIQAGVAHARKTAQVTVGPGTILTVPAPPAGASSSDNPLLPAQAVA
jgi:hypothetical protein